MSHTSTLLRSRRGGVHSSSNGSPTPERKSAGTTTSLPMYYSNGVSSSRIFSPRSKLQRDRTTIFLVTALVLVGLVGGGSYYQLRGTNSTDHKNTARTLLDAAALGVEGPIHDIVIAGAGPAGLTAALFGARAGLDVMVLGSETGLLSETQHLDNFPSYTDGNGPAWLKATKQQAIQFGAKFATAGVLATELQQSSESGLFTLTTNSQNSKEQMVHAWSVIVATGASPRHLGLPKEELLWGKTLHSCAICDGHLYLDKNVIVVGGGDSAIDAAILLARYANQVYVVHRGTQLSGKNQVAVEVASTTPNIHLLQPFVVQAWELNAENQLIGARIHRTDKHQEERVLSIDGAFVMIGADPNTEWVKDVVELDDEALVKLEGSATKTSVSGIFAVGEVADNVYKQAITASAAGAQAAIDAERWLRETHGVHKHIAVPQQAVAKEETHSRPEVERRAEEPEAKDDATITCDMTEQDCISQIVSSHTVVVFSKSWCPYCRKAMEALAAAGIPEPFVVDLSANPNTQAVQATLGSMTGRRTVPNVFVGGKSIGGGDETSALQARGKLVPLLVAAGALDASSEGSGDGEDGGNSGNEDCNLAEQSCIEAIIKKYPVVMFSLEWCPECKHSLELLARIGAKMPHIIDLDDYKEISQEIRYHMMTISGRRSVPNLYIGGEFFGGFAQTTKMHQEGKLISKLQEVGWPIETA